MGYGGALIWTGLARNLKRTFPDKKIIFVYHPGWKNFVLRRPHPDHSIYLNNSDIYKIYTNIGWFFARWMYKKDTHIAVDMDEKRFHYWLRDTEERLYFKQGKHYIQIACDAFHITNPELKPKLTLTEKERANVDVLEEKNELVKKQFICIEPHSKATFTPNKAWPLGRWEDLAQKITEYIAEKGLPVKLVQLGVKTNEVLPGAVNLTGTTSFREAKGLLEDALFFIGTEGGLMHLANTTDTKSVVLLSTWLPRALASYPSDHVIYKDEFAHECGLKTPCEVCQKSMEAISVDEVFNVCKSLLEKEASVK